MNLDDLILHSKSHAQLSNYLNHPMHALLLTGKSGVGLGTIAKALAHEIAGANTVIIEPQLHNQQKTKTINIDDIRGLHELTRAARQNNFAIVIDDADRMTNDAPQAFLKLLEEPTPNTFYILTSHNTAALPETIRSRTQIIEILPPPADSVQDLYKSCHSEPVSESTESLGKILKQERFTKLTAEKRAKIDFLGNRRPAEIVRLLNDEEYFRDTSVIIETAKKFIQSDTQQRLKIIVSTTTREAAIELSENIARLLILTASRSKNPKGIAGNLATISDVIDNLAQNGNVRAQLTNLALNI